MWRSQFLPSGSCNVCDFAPHDDQAIRLCVWGKRHLADTGSTQFIQRVYHFLKPSMAVHFEDHQRVQIIIGKGVENPVHAGGVHLMRGIETPIPVDIVVSIDSDGYRRHSVRYPEITDAMPVGDYYLHHLGAGEVVEVEEERQYEKTDIGKRRHFNANSDPPYLPTMIAISAVDHCAPPGFLYVVLPGRRICSPQASEEEVFQVTGKKPDYQQKNQPGKESELPTPTVPIAHQLS